MSMQIRADMGVYNQMKCVTHVSKMDMYYFSWDGSAQDATGNTWLRLYISW